MSTIHLNQDQPNMSTITLAQNQSNHSTITLAEDQTMLSYLKARINTPSDANNNNDNNNNHPALFATLQEPSLYAGLDNTARARALRYAYHQLILATRAHYQTREDLNLPVPFTRWAYEVGELSRVSAMLLGEVLVIPDQLFATRLWTLVAEREYVDGQTAGLMAGKESRIS
ncbi:hypothetical protein B0A50_05681 [Salinomyces thailandicus]|uniref:Uncharacterized protein n=1 Tax=Salinomyces thailandicus TaxID=706561 RepID=A0A4U0TRA0_9PEZI|nr:hypothetical protein B0A50_05681 [Salinomyces thailandica]